MIATPSSTRAGRVVAPDVPTVTSSAVSPGTSVTGFSAGGEGAMLEQELTQTKETLAAREQLHEALDPARGEADDRFPLC